MYGTIACLSTHGHLPLRLQQLTLIIHSSMEVRVCTWKWKTCQDCQQHHTKVTRPHLHATWNSHSHQPRNIHSQYDSKLVYMHAGTCTKKNSMHVYSRTYTPWLLLYRALDKISTLISIPPTSTSIPILSLEINPHQRLISSHGIAETSWLWCSQNLQQITGLVYMILENINHGKAAGS